MKIFFNLDEIRRKSNKTQNQLAAISGLSQSYLSEIENKKKSPTLRAVEKISNALHVHPYTLIQIEESNIEYYL